ncbi:MAG: enoyl-CoA hydratase/isomerase family protein [Hyphomonadaceae bacterium]|nr:enoyl-CoA hydratase/isomerase family protein [Hyphomonadaceae bacterium]
MSDAPDPVLLDVSPEGIAIVTLNRPAKGNAFDELMITGLSDTFETLKGADHVRAVFVRGAGESFCSGADADWLSRSLEFADIGAETDALTVARMLQHFHALPQLTVALVHGEARGAGAGLVAASDVAVAASNTTFRFDDVRHGLIPALVAPYVVEAVGRRRAKALFATAESFAADYAERIGLVQYVVDDEAGLTRMIEHISDLALAAAPGAVSEVKTLVDFIALHKADEALARETARRHAARLGSSEGREGLSAQRENRKPGWRS